MIPLHTEPVLTSVPPATLVDLLVRQSLLHPDKTAFTYLTDGEFTEVSVTYRELDRQARAIATHLQGIAAPGARMLLIYPQGLEYIAAFFGCLYAGMVAIPVYPPSLNRNMLRLQAILDDAGARIAMTTSPLLLRMESQFLQTAEFRDVLWLPTDLIANGPHGGWEMPELGGDTLAFMQYTSGSTGRPKGVMLTHANLLHNERVLEASLENTSETVNVSWLPLYHDMGLIGNILHTVYLGSSCVLLSPVDFLQRPFRWLQAISRFKGTYSGGPNFAYELCVRKVTEEQMATLDLSSWGQAFNGAEPVRTATLDRFAEKFGPCGFRREAMNPCYGLAEATLVVTATPKSELPKWLTVDVSALEEGIVRTVAKDAAEARTIVSCGRVFLDQQVVIANPETYERCRPDQIGEIWLQGPSVAQGYWNCEEATEETFRAHLSDSGEGPFLRTGDLGFLQDGELFVTGRLKDLILIRGRNYYPQDIELTTESAHEAIRTGCCAAFSVEGDGEERLVVVAELDRAFRPRKKDSDDGSQAAFYKAVIGAIRRAVAEEYQIQVSAVQLLKHGSIPKTSSGKIQRHACSTGYLTNTLDVWGV
jgi:acyl-CoA synthetase (AMP-forming)/AMP-acid ligase II